MTIGTVAIGQAAKTIETLALCLAWVCSPFLLQSVQADEIVTVIGGAKVLSGGLRAWPVCMVLGSDQIRRTSCVSSIAFHPFTVVKMWLDLCETLVWSPSFFLPAIPKSTSKSRYASRSYKCNKSVNSGQCLKHSTDTTCAYVPHLQSKANHRRVCRIQKDCATGSYMRRRAGNSVSDYSMYFFLFVLHGHTELDILNLYLLKGILARNSQSMISFLCSVIILTWQFAFPLIWMCCVH